MSETMYWLSHFVTSGVLLGALAAIVGATTTSIVSASFAHAYPLFSHTDWLVVFGLQWCGAMAFVAQALLLSSLVSRPRAANFLLGVSTIGLILLSAITLILPGGVTMFLKMFKLTWVQAVMILLSPSVMLAKSWAVIGYVTTFHEPTERFSVESAYGQLKFSDGATVDSLAECELQLLL